MSRDIDHIIERVSQRIPGVKVQQHWVKNPKVDDDGVWWFYLPGFKKQIQIESSNGMCPFVVEHDEKKTPFEGKFGATIEDAVEMFSASLPRMKGEMLR